jgi:Tfp pilus assembly protein PilF
VAFPQRFRLAGLIGLSLFSTLGCSLKGAESPVVNPKRQSQAEYDVAVDYFYHRQPRLALDHCRKAIELDDENAKALYFASIVHLSFCSGLQGLQDPDCRIRDAEAYVRRALTADTNFREAKNTLGQILILEQRYPEAISVLAPLTKDPAFESSYLAWGNLGWAQVLSGRVDEGIGSLKNSITEPRFCVGHYRLGIAYEKKGDLTAAERSLSNAVGVDAPECKELQDAWAGRARVRAALGRREDARSDFEKCVDISSETGTGRICAEGLAKLRGANGGDASN